MLDYLIFFESEMAGPNMDQSAFILIHTDPVKAESPQEALQALRERHRNLYSRAETEHAPKRYLMVAEETTVIVRDDGSIDNDATVTVETTGPWD